MYYISIIIEIRTQRFDVWFEQESHLRKPLTLITQSL